MSATKKVVELSIDAAVSVEMAVRTQLAEMERRFKSMPNSEYFPGEIRFLKESLEAFKKGKIVDA